MAACLMAGGAGISTVDLLQEAEVYDPGGNIWTVTGSRVIGRPWFTITTLEDGTGLAAGGGNDTLRARCTSPSPGSGHKPAMCAPTRFTLTALPDGRALAVGGTSTRHLYDPLSRTWRVSAAPQVVAFTNDCDAAGGLGGARGRQRLLLLRKF